MSESSSITRIAYDTLRGDVLSCRLAPGTKIVIADICKERGFSPGAVREALSRLTSEGLIIAEPQKGFRVTPISREDLLDMTEVRANIEAQCLRRAIELGDLAWEGRIIAIYHQLARTPERAAEDASRVNDSWAKVHHQFHATLVEACDSPWLLRIREMLYAQSERYRRLSVPLAHQTRELDREHHGIMQAVLARDPDQASVLIGEHLRKTTDILLSSAVLQSSA
ncbi:GntR family transcriptional regulator [Paracoccus pacificus]|uniref:GntR family transcriptional regulator n=1 Tax=Paracoccus pacificus TaxID=1463598 RepID=A0ABW4R5C2_9RHOB